MIVNLLLFIFIIVLNYMNSDTDFTFDNRKYILSVDGLFSEHDTTNIKKFREEQNEECYIEFTIVEPDNSVYIDYFKCTSEAGSGRILMKDFLTYLLNYPQSIAISKNTKISLTADAFALHNYRIRRKDHDKLIKYYQQLGFSLIKKDSSKLIGDLGTIIEKIENYTGDKKGKKSEYSSTKKKKKSEGGSKKKRKTKGIRYTKRQT